MGREGPSPGSLGRRGRIAMVAGGVLAMAFAWVLLRSDGPGALVVRVFGPPGVVLTEVYESSGDGATFDHGDFDALLGKFVDDEGFVDYAGLAERRADLGRYLDALAAAPFDGLGRDEKLALLINAYNAFTLELILEHRPLESIRDIPAARRWDAVRWKIAGRTSSLDRIEHQWIRPSFREPRIHFALVCAAVGCPPLRREAYTGARIDAQLEDQARRVHGSERWVRKEPDADRIGLTALYEWYRGDFEQVADTILAYVARYRPDVDLDDPPDVYFLDYDWSLNDQARR